MGVFDSKNFNSEVFGRYLETVPRVKQNAFLKAGVLRPRQELKSMLDEQTGGNFITVPMSGRIGGDPLNYDGDTDITASGLDTYLQSMIVVGRAKAWKEKDFTKDITGKDFMEVIASQVSDYWDDVDQTTILSTLSGIFGVSSFANSNTLDITTAASAADKVAGPATLNNTIQKAAGANKGIYTLVIMHSQVATNLENLQILSYWKETDENAVQRPVALASWNGRTVLIDDDVPTARVETTAGVYSATITTKATSGDTIAINGVELVAGTDFSLSTNTAAGNATAIATALNASTDTRVSGYTWSTDSATLIATEDSGHYGDGPFTVSVEQGESGTMVVGAVSTTTAAVVQTSYTSYLMGQGALDYCDCGAKTPSETWRDPKTKGGEDWLITRQRHVYAPKGFSFVQPTVPIVSPTDTQLANGARWKLVTNNAGEDYPTKAIPIARIISLG